MRFMAMVRLKDEPKPGTKPSVEDMAAMGAFNERLEKAGVLLEAYGLRDSSMGARVVFDGDKPTVIDGPFAESKELISGYWIVQMQSLQEAIEWFRQAPTFANGDAVEIRPFWEPEDFGEEFTAKVHEREARLRNGAGA